MEILQHVPRLQIEGMSPEESVMQMSLYISEHVVRMQEEIYLLRQFLEPAIKNNDNSPDQIFNPLD